MARIAVDIALLPSDRMMEKAIEANRQLINEPNKKTVLNKDNCLPHISLAMGCVDEDDIREIELILRDIAKVHFPQELKAVGVYIGTSVNGEKLSLYYIEKTQTLQLLHEQVMMKLSAYLSYDVTADMLLTPPEIEERTLLWIKNYRNKASFEKFLPHITIGFGEARALDFPIECAPLRLVLCHLGNDCTCRKVLALVESND